MKLSKALHGLPVETMTLVLCPNNCVLICWEAECVKMSRGKGEGWGGRGERRGGRRKRGSRLFDKFNHGTQYLPNVEVYGI